MDEIKISENDISEADLDLFYGFFDDVLKEPEVLGDSDDPLKAADVTEKEAEWYPDPFEEFIVGLPAPDPEHNYALHPQQPLPINIKGQASGFLIGMAVYITIITSAYSLSTTSEAEYNAETQAHIERIEENLSAVQEKVESVQSLKQQLQAMEERLQRLSEVVASTPAPAPVAATAETTAPAATTPTATVATEEATIQASLPTPVEAKTELNPAVATPPEPVTSAKTTTVTTEVLIPAATPPTIEKSAAIQLGDGDWVVNLVSVRHIGPGEKELSRIRAMGIPAEAVKIDINGKTWTRIRIEGLASKEQAEQARKLLLERTGLPNMWIGKR